MVQARIIARGAPAALAAVAAALLGHWLAVSPALPDTGPRLPGQDGAPAVQALAPEVDLTGTLVRGSGIPAEQPGAWPRFRGGNFDGISAESTPLARQWPAGGPQHLWSVELGEGYAGAAVERGRVYVLDYDQNSRADVVRCLSMGDGREIWRRSYSVDIPRNHGISRTVPAVADGHVVTLGPKCHVVCLDAVSGEFRWGLDLVRQYGATVPQWYAGQCSLIDAGRVILAPGGGDALLVSIDLKTGKEVWRTPNPRRWQMTHSSVMPMSFGGRKMYVYSASGGVAGVSAEDGALLWESSEWKVTMANVPSPLPIGDGRIFLTGGYGAGSMMVRLSEGGAGLTATPVFRLKADVFGAEQHTPILHGGFIYGIVPGGQLVCLDLEGRRRWASGAAHRFGLGPYIIADGMIVALDEHGELTLVEATERGFNLLARASVLDDGHEAWGPLALAGGRLIARDLTRMVCLDLRRSSP